MKVEELRLLVKDVVRETMREELRDILVEAVQIASTPGADTPSAASKPHFQTPDWVKDLEVKAAQGVERQMVQESSQGVKSPMDMLKDTAKHMTSADLSNFS